LQLEQACAMTATAFAPSATPLATPFAAPDGSKPITEYRFPHLQRLASPAPASVRAKAVLAVAGTSAFTYGWDTAFAIRMPDANAAIVKAGASPKTFTQVAPDNSCTANGSFGPWQICRGGDGVLIHFAIPLTAGSMVYQGQTYAMAGGVATIEVALRQIPPQSVPGQAPASAHDLVVQTLATSVTQPAVSVIDLKLPVDPGFICKALMSGLLDAWFNANLDQFTHVFNTVTINKIVDKAQFQWLAPTHTSYAYANGATDEDCVFGVLCMTQNRPDGGIASQLSPNAIPAGARSGFLIARERFLEEMVLPALPTAFPGSAATDFAMSSDKTAVISVANVNAKSVECAGITYQPVVISLNISVEGDEIVVSSVTRTDIALGTYSEVTVTSYQRLKAATKPDGSQTLVYEQSRPPIQDHSTKSSADGEALKIILEVAAAVIALVLTVLTDGAFLIVALIILSLLVGLLEALPALIANAVGNQVSDASPSLALLVSNSTDPIRWPGGSDYVLTSAGLNDSLQLGGNPGFA
jgi:Clostridium P-47 protein